MRLVYKGKFDGDPGSIPHGEHIPGAVKFREPGDPKKMSLIANLLALSLTALFVCLLVLRYGFSAVFAPMSCLGAALPILTLLPHELLHALCFRDTVYLYTYLSKGAAFVTGPETMSRGRFVFMSLLPNLVFGFLPLAAGFLSPKLITAGVFGAVAAGMGAGDYFNVFNALAQMPKGARTYLYGFNSYWYRPE